MISTPHLGERQRDQARAVTKPFNGLLQSSPLIIIVIQLQVAETESLDDPGSEW